LRFNLFPNPTNDVLNTSIIFPKKVNSVIEIFDISGKILTTASFSSRRIDSQFKVSKFAAGTYFFKLSSSGKMATKKFVVQ